MNPGLSQLGNPCLLDFPISCRSGGCRREIVAGNRNLLWDTFSEKPVLSFCRRSSLNDSAVATTVRSTRKESLVENRAPILGSLTKGVAHYMDAFRPSTRHLVAPGLSEC